MLDAAEPACEESLDLAVRAAASLCVASRPSRRLRACCSPATAGRAGDRIRICAPGRRCTRASRSFAAGARAGAVRAVARGRAHDAVRDGRPCRQRRTPAGAATASAPHALAGSGRALFDGRRLRRAGCSAAPGREDARDEQRSSRALSRRAALVARGAPTRGARRRRRALRAFARHRARWRRCATRHC